MSGEEIDRLHRVVDGQAKEIKLLRDRLSCEHSKNDGLKCLFIGGVLLGFFLIGAIGISSNEEKERQHKIELLKIEKGVK